MSRLRRLAIVLMAVGLITSAIYATGAFTNITAQRDANIRVAGDGSSYLSLQPANGSNGQYATQRGGQLRVSLGGALGEGGGAGVNRESLTVVRDIFTITNKGAQPLGVWVTDSSEAVTFERGEKRRTLEGKQQAVRLNPGDSVTVGLTVDTRQHNGENLIKSVQIHADSDVSGAAVGSGASNPVGNTAGSPPSPPSSDSTSKGDAATTEKGSDGSNGHSDNNGNGGGGLGKQIADAAGNAVDGVADAGGDVINGVADVGGDIVNGFAKAGNTVANTVGGPGGKVMGASIFLAGPVSQLDGPLPGLADLTAGGIIVGGVIVGGTIAGGAYLYDQVTTTAKEDTIQSEKEAKEKEKEEHQANHEQQQEEDDDDEKRPRINGTRLIADGGKSPAEIKKTLSDGKLIEDSLTDKNHRHIAEQGTVDETMIALTPSQERVGDGEVIWLEKGHSGAGWKHILQRHEEDFYGRSSISTRAEIKEIIYKTMVLLNPLTASG